MEKNNTFQEIWDKLSSAKKVVMTLHAAPDGDSLGACTAMKKILEKKLKCQVEIVSYDSLADNLMLMPIAKEIKFGIDISDVPLTESDVFLFLDSELKNQSGKLKDKFSIKEAKFVINIDHHSTNLGFGNLNYVDGKRPSACSVLIDFCRELNIEIDKELANRLLLGVCTDSGFFTYSNAQDALKDASFLISCGADYVGGILSPILYNQPLKLKKYFAFLINRIKINKEKGFAYSSISKDEIRGLGLNESEVRLGINELMFIQDFNFVFTLAEFEDYIKGSFRSTKKIDVSKFAQALGGGGHKSAASFRLAKMSLQEAEKKVLEAIKKAELHKIS